MQPDFSKNNGLLSVILQDSHTKQVLMNGFMNEEAFKKTTADNVVWFYSRSKERLWKKGETSGNIQEVVSMALDCEQDALLIQVNPKGPTCHTRVVLVMTISAFRSWKALCRIKLRILKKGLILNILLKRDSIKY